MLIKTFDNLFLHSIYQFSLHENNVNLQQNRNLDKLNNITNFDSNFNYLKVITLKRRLLSSCNDKQFRPILR